MEHDLALEEMLNTAMKTEVRNIPLEEMLHTAMKTEVRNILAIKQQCKKLQT